MLRCLKFGPEVFSGTKQATGYEKLSIILSRKEECEARNKLAQITHRAVWYINSHFHTPTKKEMKKKTKRKKKHDSH